MSDTRVPEIELVKFLSEILVRQPARHRLKPFEHKARGRIKRYENGTPMYAPFRMRESDYGQLCMLVNQCRREYGWSIETFLKEDE